MNSTLAAALARLNRDLQSAPRSISVRALEQADGRHWALYEGDRLSASVGESGVDLADVEQVTLARALALDDCLWPDDLTGPWPACPTHRDHPLMPRALAGRASWVCDREPGRVVCIAIGELVDPPPTAP